jgi:hypothetical protein
MSQWVMLGDCQLDADSKDIATGEAAAHPVLVGVHDNPIVVVDEQPAQRRGSVCPRRDAGRYR